MRRVMTVNQYRKQLMTARVFLSCIFPILCLLTIGCRSGRVSSQIVSEEDSTEPVAGASVTMVKGEYGAAIATTVTDEEGVFHFSLTKDELERVKEDSSYGLVVNKPLLLRAQSFPLDLASKQVLPSKIPVPLLAAVRGRVVDKANPQKGIGSIEVMLFKSEQFARQVKSNTLGLFEFSFLPEGRYKLRLDHPFYYPTETDTVIIESGVVRNMKVPVEKLPQDGILGYRELKKAGKWQRIEIRPKYGPIIIAGGGFGANDESLRAGGGFGANDGSREEDLHYEFRKNTLVIAWKMASMIYCDFLAWELMFQGRIIDEAKIPKYKDGLVSLKIPLSKNSLDGHYTLFIRCYERGRDQEGVVLDFRRNEGEWKERF